MSPPFSPPSSPSDLDPIWALPGLRAEPSWLQYLSTGYGGGPILEDPSGRRQYYRRSVQIGYFALALPGEFAFFSGRLARLGLLLPRNDSFQEADLAIEALGDQGVRITLSAARLRAVGRNVSVFFVIEEARGDEPLLPLDWLATCELEGDDVDHPWWIGRRRLDCERRDAIDWSRYEPRGFGWKLLDTPPLSRAFTDPPS